MKRDRFVNASTQALEAFETWSSSTAVFSCNICLGQWKQFESFKLHLRNFHVMKAYIYFIEQVFKFDERLGQTIRSSQQNEFPSYSSAEMKRETNKIPGQVEAAKSDESKSQRDSDTFDRENNGTHTNTSEQRATSQRRCIQEKFPLVYANDLHLNGYKDLLSLLSFDNKPDFACAVCNVVMASTVETVADHLRLSHQINLLQYHRLFVVASVTAGFFDCCLYQCPLCVDAFYSVKNSFLYHMRTKHASASSLDYRCNKRFENATLVTSFLFCPVCKKAATHSSDALLGHIKRCHPEKSKDKDELLTMIQSMIRSFEPTATDLTAALEAFLHQNSSARSADTKQVGESESVEGTSSNSERSALSTQPQAHHERTASNQAEIRPKCNGSSENNVSAEGVSSDREKKRRLNSFTTSSKSTLASTRENVHLVRREGAKRENEVSSHFSTHGNAAKLYRQLIADVLQSNRQCRECNSSHFSDVEVLRKRLEAAQNQVRRAEDRLLMPSSDKFNRGTDENVKLSSSQIFTYTNGDPMLRFHHPTVVLTRIPKSETEPGDVRDSKQKKQCKKRKVEVLEPRSAIIPTDAQPGSSEPAPAQQRERPWFSGVSLRCPACAPQTNELASYLELQRHLAKEHGSAFKPGRAQLLPSATLEHSCRLCGQRVVRDLVIIKQHLNEKHNTSIRAYENKFGVANLKQDIGEQTIVKEEDVSFSQVHAAPDVPGAIPLPTEVNQPILSLARTSTASPQGLSAPATSAVPSASAATTEQATQMQPHIRYLSDVDIKEESSEEPDEFKGPTTLEEIQAKTEMFKLEYEYYDDDD